jgi:oligopeptide/dipeptide ABC transporter ATP-binding protein
MNGSASVLVGVRDLAVHYELRGSNPFAERHVTRAVDGISFEVVRGTSFGIVGESGSGKSTTAAALMRLTDITSGSVTFDGTSLDAIDGEELRKFRRRLQMVFQDPYSSLDPRSRVGDIIREPLDIQAIGTRKEREERVTELLALVGLRPDMRRLFPHQFSGGQRQRIGIARALATYPELIVCDEPVSALDVAVQAQILNLLKRLQRERGLTFVFISHDLGVVRYMCDHVAVMYLGKIIETADAKALFARPAHPYTIALLEARPSIHARDRPAVARMRALAELPSQTEQVVGCRFAARCPRKEDRCIREAPALRQVGESHHVACHFAG